MRNGRGKYKALLNLCIKRGNLIAFVNLCDKDDATRIAQGNQILQVILYNLIHLFDRIFTHLELTVSFF